MYNHIFLIKTINQYYTYYTGHRNIKQFDYYHDYTLFGINILSMSSREFSMDCLYTLNVWIMMKMRPIVVLTGSKNNDTTFQKRTRVAVKQFVSIFLVYYLY